MIDKQDIHELQEWFDARYKLKGDCDREMGEVASKLSADATRLAVMNTKLSLVLWFLGAIGAAVITVLVKIVFGG